MSISCFEKKMVCSLMDSNQTLALLAKVLKENGNVHQQMVGNIMNNSAAAAQVTVKSEVGMGGGDNVKEFLPMNSGMISAVNMVKEIVDMCGYNAGNGTMKQPFPWSSHYYRNSKEENCEDSYEILIWVPEICFNGLGVKHMPCPNCGDVRSLVVPDEWKLRSWFFHRQNEKESYKLILAKQYMCKICATKFSGWHPSAIAHLPKQIQQLFPLHHEQMQTPECRFMWSTETTSVSGANSPTNHIDSKNLLLTGLQQQPGLNIAHLPAFAHQQQQQQMHQQQKLFQGSMGYGLFPSHLQSSVNAVNGGISLFGTSAGGVHPYHQQQQPQNYFSGVGGQHRFLFPPQLGAGNANGLVHTTMRPTPPIKREASVPSPAQSSSTLYRRSTDEQSIGSSDDQNSISESLKAERRSIQFCSVCFGVRRQKGKLVGGHKPDGFCPIKCRRATAEEKRELRRRRQKMRRAMSKHKNDDFDPVVMIHNVDNE